MALAILSALPEEQAGLQHLLPEAQTVRHAGRDFTMGRLHGHTVVLGLTGIGKVAAATTATVMMERFNSNALLFTGVAGGVGAGVQVGDVVVAQQFLQHDMDVRPLFPRWQVPGYAAPVWDCDAAMSTRLLAAAQDCVAHAAQWHEPLLMGHAPRVHAGLVASGDQFIVSAAVAGRITGDLVAEGHTPLAVEMEGAAIAQVCADYEVPFAAVRTISDRADDTAHVDFPAFVQAVASRYALHIVQHWIRQG